MKGLPKPHVNDLWPPDITQDYAHAPDDEARRRILLAAGYDKAYRTDALRLFPKLKKRDDELNEIAAPKEKKIPKFVARVFGNYSNVILIVLTVVMIILMLLPSCNPK